MIDVVMRLMYSHFCRNNPAQQPRVHNPKPNGEVNMASSTNLITGKKTRKPSKPAKPTMDERRAKVEADVDAETQAWQVEEDALAAVKAEQSEADELAALKLELAQMKQQLAVKQGVAKNTIKVSKKGCVSVYGMGRFPISFYKSQWAKLFSMKDEIEAFIEQHKDALPDKKVADKAAAKK